jgi:hypothetical protein
MKYNKFSCVILIQSFSLAFFAALPLFLMLSLSFSEHSGHGALVIFDILEVECCKNRLWTVFWFPSWCAHRDSGGTSGLRSDNNVKSGSSGLNFWSWELRICGDRRGWKGGWDGWERWLLRNLSGLWSNVGYWHGMSLDLMWSWNWLDSGFRCLSWDGNCSHILRRRDGNWGSEVCSLRLWSLIILRSLSFRLW